MPIFNKIGDGRVGCLSQIPESAPANSRH